MAVNINHHHVTWDPEPRWPAFIAVAAVGGLYLALPSYLTIGPRWGYIAIVFVLLIPAVIAHRIGHEAINKVLGITITIVVTIEMIASLILLISALPAHKETPIELLRSAASLWFTNVLVFGLWYWRLDAGGPHERDKVPGHQGGAFLFPQMSMDTQTKALAGETHWSPNYFDYLFLSFNTSTAFSPTDTPVLARWAKVMMMIQSIISLTVVVLLAARAVNIL